MFERLNYTNRVRILRESVGVKIRDMEAKPAIADISLALSSYEFPAEAEVVAEAYCNASYARESIGRVDAIPASFAFKLTEFDSAEGVRFRIKVIGRRQCFGKDAPSVLGVADRIGPEGGASRNPEGVKLLRFRPADLNGEIWRLDLDDSPLVLVERDYWADRQFMASDWIQPMIMPTVLRDILRAALDGGYRELHDDDWRSQWLRFALAIPGERELPAVDGDCDDWINARVEAFCRSQSLRGRIDRMLRGED